MAALGAFLILRLGDLGEELPQVVVPGSTELALSEPGSYTIFHESESVVDGRYYAVSDVSGLHITVSSVETGQELPVRTAGSSSTYSFGGRSGRSVLAFDVDDPGIYRISGAYQDGRAEPATVMAVGHDFNRKLVVTVLVGLALGFGSFGLALTIAIVTYLRRRRAGREPVAPATAT